MIKYLLIVLLHLLGFENNNQRPVNSLHKQPEKRSVNPELKKWIIMGIGMVLILVLIFMFAPGTESGVWYNNPHY